MPQKDLRQDPDLKRKLEALRERWKTGTPDREWSVLTAEGEAIYLARYPEGIVLRAGEEGASVSFLTNEMAFEMWRELATRT